MLELGCGTGRVLLPLAQAGFHALGIDRDRSMLKFLSGGIVPGEPAPWLVAADMSRFNLAMRFPLIILPCNTFSTLEDEARQACLLCVRRHLASRGVFAVSLPNPLLLANAPRHAPAEYEDEFTLPQTGNPVQVSSTLRRTGHTVALTWIYDHLLPDGQVQRFMLRADQHIFTPEQLIDQFGRAGLQVSEMFGDFDRSPYRGDSPHLVVLAEA